MRETRFLLVLSVVACLLVGALAISSFAAPQAQPSAAEKSVWQLEHDYWRYVQNNDLKSYSTLWHQNFLGWPAVSPTPARKDRITDWITAQTSQSRALNSFDIQPAAFQLNGDVAVVCYWVNYAWLDKDGKGDSLRSRIQHTWRKSGNTWLIISGMSMPEAAPPK